MLKTVFVNKLFKLLLTLLVHLSFASFALNDSGYSHDFPGAARKIYTRHLLERVYFFVTRSYAHL